MCSKLCYAVGGAPYQTTGCALGFFLQIYLLDVAQVPGRWDGAGGGGGARLGSLWGGGIRVPRGESWERPSLPGSALGARRSTCPAAPEWGESRWWNGAGVLCP